MYERHDESGYPLRMRALKRRLGWGAIATAVLGTIAPGCANNDSKNTSGGGAGEAGARGSAGSAGSSGNAGSVGVAGQAGSLGTAGDAGPAGNAGSAGAAGHAGSAGASGSAGAAGSSGSAGLAGTSGNAGSAGSSGNAGSSGSSGNAGSAGSSGNAGSAGSSGSSGSAGSAGTGTAHCLTPTPHCQNDVDCPSGQVCDPASCKCASPYLDPSGDGIDSISSNPVTFFAAWFDIGFFFFQMRFLTLTQLNLLFNNSIYECGTASSDQRVVCPTGVTFFDEGNMLTAMMELRAPVPMNDPNHSYIYSLVIDSDGNPANNWIPQGPFDWDLFQGADRWYQLIWNHQTGQWSVTVTQVDSSQATTTVSSAVRVLIDGDRIYFFVPDDEFTASAPGARLTAFGHDGTFNPNDRGADVNGANPTEPLMTPGSP